MNAEVRNNPTEYRYEVWVDGDTAAVEMESLSTASNGKPFDNWYCWVTRFSNGTIVELREGFLSAPQVRHVFRRN